MMMVEDHQQLNRHWVTKIDMLKKHQKWLPNEKLGDPGYGQHAQSPSNLHEVQDFEARFCAVFRVFTYEGVEIFWKKNHGCVELAKLYHFTYFFFNEVFF